MRSKFILLAALCGLVTSAYATVITVSNNPNSPGQYSDLQEAIDAASANDTLYVHGSATEYSIVTINKPLTIIGAGALPNNSTPLGTSIAGINLGFHMDGLLNASGSEITGCKIGNLNFAYKQITWEGIDNVEISRNQITFVSFHSSYGAMHNNHIFKNNVIYSFQGSGSIDNVLITNNIIHDINSLSSYGRGVTLLSNNVITGQASGIQSTLVTNNIFYIAYNNSTSYSTYTNNLFYTTGTIPFSETMFSASNNTGSGNILNQDPEFILYTPPLSIILYITQTSPGPFPNFALSPTSVGKSYGTDGTDIGIYGGPTPFVEGSPADSRYRYFPMPAIPQMLDVTINNTSVPLNGVLSVNFSAAKQD